MADWENDTGGNWDAGNKGGPSGDTWDKGDAGGPTGEWDDKKGGASGDNWDNGDAGGFGGEGHGRPPRGPIECKNCGQEGHMFAKCTNPRQLNREDVADMPAEKAWEELVAAIKEREVEDCKEAIQKYLKQEPTMTYRQLQSTLYEEKHDLFFIGLEKNIVPTLTNMDLQGNLNKKYTISYRFSMTASRPREVEGWPKDIEEILLRLDDAGETVPNGLSRCSNCSEVGHISKNCPQEKLERTDKPTVQCFNCGETGHRFRDCQGQRKDKYGCKNCGKSGHQARECPEPRSAENVECRKCNEIGHFSKDCPTAGPRGCRNCGQEGHISKECTEPRNMDLVQCRNCEEMGHYSKACPKPRDISKVKCSNCGEMGHYQSRCPNPKASNDDDGFGGGGGGGHGAGGGGGSNWNGGDTAASTGGEDWPAAGGDSGAAGGDDYNKGGNAADDW